MPRKTLSRAILLVSALSILSYVCPAVGECAKIDPEKVKRLEWIDPLGREPTSFQQLKALQLPSAPLKVRTIGRLSPIRIQATKSTDSLVAVIVNPDLYAQVQTSIDQYAVDLLAEGYTVEQILWSGGDYQDLRDSLKYRWTHSALVGAVLVGDLPVPWCELNVWDPEEFPIDYYLMELDGTWSDSDGDGLLDGLTAGSGDLGPEIWVGRIAPSSLVWGNEAELVQNYFTKNHNYRTGSLSLPHRALSFVDDDWDYFEDCDLGYAYEDVTIINGLAESNAAEYKQRLLENYEWVQLCAHSSCWAHTFKLNWAPGGGSVYNFEVHALRPHALFYNLFACSNTKFMETNNLGNWYIFVDDYGLLAIGSTKSGSMLDFVYFYDPLGQGYSIGDAYKQWFEVQAAGGFEDWEQGWFFGMNVLGDPTLTIDVQSQVTQSPDSTEFPDICGSSGWSAAQVTTSSFSDGSPTVAADLSGTIWAVWETGRNIRSDIYSSSYDGSSWSPAEPVVQRDYWDFHPSMATDSLGKVWVAWQSLQDAGGNYWNMDICVSYRNGGAWSPLQVITAGPDYDEEPSMTVDDMNRVWVVWKGWRTVDQNVNSNVFAKYYDGSWSPRITITSDLHDDADPVAACDDAGRVWVVWSANRDGNWDIYSVYYDGAWSSLTPITTDPGDDLAPTVTTDASGDIWVAWHSWRDGDANIYTSYNDGGGWSVPVPITFDPGNDIMPNLGASSSNELSLTWMSNRCGNWDVFASSYDGFSWSAAEQVTSDPGGDYEPVSLFDSDGAPTFLWGSDRDADWNVYFADEGFLPPTLIYPEDLSYINDDTPLLQWSAAGKNADPSAITYTLQYSTDVDFVSNVTTVLDLAESYYQVPGGDPLDQITYYWRVQAVKEAGDSTGYQDPFAFTIDTDTPEVPGMIHPADDSLLCGTTPTFEWSSVLRDDIISTAPTRYTLQYSTTEDFTAGVTTVDSLVDNSYSVPGGGALDPLLIHYWRVQAFDLAGNYSGYQATPFGFSLYILGDANHDGEVHLGDPIHLLNYLFKGGPAPIPFQAGDASSDGEVELGDAVYLLNYLFKDGPAPACD